MVGIRSKKRNPIVYIICTLALIVSLCSVSVPSRILATQYGYIAKGVSNVYFREVAGGDPINDLENNPIMLQGGQTLKILDTTNSSWYKVSVELNEIEYTGYVSAQYIVIDDTVDDKKDSEEPVVEENLDEDIQLAGDEFEAKLTAQGFPESYKTYLRQIHNVYPNWEFEAIQTGIEWNTLLDNEINKTGQIKNLVYGTSSYPHYNWRSINVGYNYATDSWSPYDGTVWYAASNDLVAYYLDPRTYLYENYIFVFESLAYQEGVQNEIGVEAILKGSFMYQTVPQGESKTYAQIIMEAGQQSGVSPYHIASRIKMEMGNSIGTACSGTNSSYPGIYNFYNIGAFDTANGNAAVKGLAWAASAGSYGRPWDSVSKSIIGGAQYLGASYIAVGQNTLYTQKFNVTNKGSLFSHQYMTNIQAPANECLTNYNAYRNNNLLNSTMIFKIPVYNNMPEQAVSKPADSGNPNNWLKSLSVDGYALTPTFAINMTTDYSLIVDDSVASINVNASTVNKNATIQGVGTYSLEHGTNVIKIKVVAQSGSERIYTLTVVKGAADGQRPIEAPAPDTPSGTAGAKGDINNDGKVNVLDIVKIQRFIVGLDSLDEVAKISADVNGDGKVNVLDIVKIQRHIVGLEVIQ